VKKDGLPEFAQKIYNDLAAEFQVIYEERDAIGKRYTRQDLIGTPFCIVVDYDSLTDNSVTIRERDSMKQERVSIDRVAEIIREKVSYRSILSVL